MEDKDKQAEEQEQAPPLGSGAMLAAARKEQNKTAEEIADELNLSLTQIRTIELDQSEGLPEPTYVRGYIRSYANLLGLNAEEVLEHYLNKNWQKSANLDDMPRGISDNEGSEGSLFSPARVMVFIAIVGVVGFFWLSGGLNGLLQSSDTEANSAPVATESSSTNQIDNEPSQASVIDGTSASLDDDAQVEEGVVDLNAAAVDATEELAAETAAGATPISTQTEVVLSFTETSWVDIRDEQQNRLAYQSYPAGDTLNVAAEGALSVLIGNAKGVVMTVNGRPYDLGQHTEGVYAKFSVGEPTQ